MNTPETSLQKSIVTWFRGQYPKVKIIASTSGQRRTVWEQVQAKALGLEKGIPDLFIARAKISATIKYGLFLEIKAGKAGKVSPEQKTYMAALENERYQCEIIRDIDQAIEIIKNYMG